METRYLFRIKRPWDEGWIEKTEEDFFTLFPDLSSCGYKKMAFITGKRDGIRWAISKRWRPVQS